MSRTHIVFCPYLLFVVLDLLCLALDTAVAQQADELVSTEQSSQPAGPSLVKLREIYRSRGSADRAFRFSYRKNDTRNEPTSLAVSPNGRFVAIGCDNSARVSPLAMGRGRRKAKFATTRLWDLTTGEEVRRFVGHENCWSVSSIAFSPDGMLVATCGHTLEQQFMESYGEETRLWDVKTGEQLGHWKDVGWTATFSPDGKKLVVNGWDGIRIIDVASGKIAQDHRLRKPGYFAPHDVTTPIVVMPDNKTALLLLRKKLTLIDLSTARELRSFETKDDIEEFTLSDDASLIATIGDDGLVVWDVKTGTEIRRFQPLSKNLFSHGGYVSITADNRLVMGITSGGDRFTWNLSSGKLVFQDKPGSGIRAATPEGKFLFRVDNCHVDVVESETGVALSRLHLFQEQRHWMSETIDGHFHGSKEFLSFMLLDPALDSAGLKADKDRVAHVFSLMNSRSAVDSAAASTIKARVRLHAIKIFPDSADLQLVVSGLARGQQIAQLNVLVDGEPVLFPGRGRIVTVERADQPIVTDVTVKFPTGLSRVQVEASFVDSEGRTSKTVRLSLTPPTTDEAVKGRLFVLCVGVSKYKYKEYNLEFSHNDALDLAEFFRSQKGNIYADVVVQDYTNEKATRDNLLKGLDWLQRSCTPRDGAVVLFAGHGIRGRRGLYFVTHEGDVEGIQYTCLNWSDVASRLAETNAGQILLLSDCCHSGAFSEDRLANQDELSRAIAEKAEVVFFASCSGDELSYEHASWKLPKQLNQDLGHGAFTFSLIEGLQGKADAGDRDGQITVGELYDYVRQRVRELTDGQQTPEIHNFKQSDTKRVLATVKP